MAEEKKVETYQYRINCVNCKTIIDLQIPKGNTIKEYLAKGVACPRCGCDALKGNVDGLVRSQSG